MSLHLPNSLRRDVFKGLTNSFIISFSSILISLLFGALVAYAIARFQMGRENGQISAAALIAIAPSLFMAIFLQKNLTRGLTMGAVK